MAASDPVSEALLEMVFHYPILEAFRNQFGANVLRILKPTPNREAYLGFDQGWILTDYETVDFERELRAAVARAGTQMARFYVGYFLQFKVVHRLVKRSHLTPDGFTAPYLRSELDLEPNATTGLSQHETLRRLAAVAGADVNYACGMVFDARRVWDLPNLDLLRLVSLKGAPSTWAADERHFLAFQDEASDAVWCSTPTPTTTRKPETWLSVENTERPEPMDSAAMLGFLDRTSGAVATHRRRSSALPGALTIIEFQGAPSRHGPRGPARRRAGPRK
jgi:hypothetical protein